MMDFLKCLQNGLPIDPLPEHNRNRDEKIPHAPNRIHDLNEQDKELAIRNALRYIPQQLHSMLKMEFQDELDKYGHIYMYRFIPKFQIKAYPIEAYPAKCQEAAAIMLMIMNNLDKDVAQFPQELVCYGGNGQVFSNWAQFWITMQFLANLDRNQTLVLSSGHPMGIFPSFTTSSRLIISNGNMVANYSSKQLYDRNFALGVTMYGQMTAGSFCYIGPQGIVHGTTITILNAARRYLKTESLTGKVFVSSGLGGMSGAQAKAGVIVGCITIIAEVSLEALNKRKTQGWLMQIENNLDQLLKRIQHARINHETISIGYYGNVVDLWEKFVQHHQKTGKLLVELGSDQTSCHCPFTGGYYPVGLTYDESKEMLKNDPEQFKELCKRSLIRQIKAINYLCEQGMHFWDYGNAFLLEAYRAGADLNPIKTPYGIKFKYPSYVQDIMGDVFSLGFGPFRWICTSGDEQDLITTDQISLEIMLRLSKKSNLDQESQRHYQDNIKWIRNAHQHRLVVGSQARILYSNHDGRVEIAIAFNNAIREGKIKGPIVISRDHHDVSGADSPFRETSNIYDGSAYTADMSILTVLGNATRGATWVALHNGGGVGFGEAENCGFGLLLDGSKETEVKARNILFWDVTNGITRRSWSGNPKALQTIEKIVDENPEIKVTKNNLPFDC